MDIDHRVFAAFYKYAYTEKYITLSLAMQTSLHRDLKNWLNGKSFDLLEFTYRNAGREDLGVSLPLRS